MSNYRLRRERKHLRRLLSDEKKRHVDQEAALKSAYVKLKYEMDRRAVRFHDSWQGMTSMAAMNQPIKAPKLEYVDFRPRLLAYMKTIDGHVWEMEKSRGSERLLNYVRREVARDIANKLISDGWVRIDLAEERAFHHYGEHPMFGAGNDVILSWCFCVAPAPFRTPSYDERCRKA